MDLKRLRHARCVSPLCEAVGTHTPVTLWARFAGSHSAVRNRVTAPSSKESEEEKLQNNTRFFWHFVYGWHGWLLMARNAIQTFCHL
jgi:hypothetical protein